MEKPKIADVLIICMFVFGLAFALTHRITFQNLPANNIVEISPQQVNRVDPTS